MCNRFRPLQTGPAQLLRAAWALLLWAAASSAAAMSAMGVSPDGKPAHASVDLRVVVHVPRVLALQTIRQPEAVELTRADIDRGYVEATMEVAVHSNMREGYGLSISHLGGFAGDVLVTGLGGTLRVQPSASAFANRPARALGMSTERLQLTFRLALGPQAREGRHAWPIRLAGAAM